MMAGAMQQFPSSFSIVTGQSSFPGQVPADPNKYVIQDDHGRLLFTATTTQLDAHSSPTGGLSVRDATTAAEMFRIFVSPQKIATIMATGSNSQIATVLLQAKPEKEKDHHKKDHHKKDKDGKKQQVVFQSATAGGSSYCMTGKMKHGGSTIDMKIKNYVPMVVGHHKDKHHHKDKSSKKSQVGEVSGNLFTGLHVKLHGSHHGGGPTVSPQVQGYNVIGLVIAYMEIERQSHTGHGGIPMMHPQAQGQIHPQQPPHYVGPSVGATTMVPPGATAFYPGQIQPGPVPPHVPQQQYFGTSSPQPMIGGGGMGFAAAAPAPGAVPGFVPPTICPMGQNIMPPGSTGTPTAYQQPPPHH